MLLTGCGGGAEPIPTAAATEMKSRSQEIQQVIYELMPPEYLSANDLNSPWKATPASPLLPCKPILSAESWQSDDNSSGYQYPGSFSARLDEGAPVEEIVDQLYQDVIHSPDLEFDPDSIPEDPSSMTQLITADGYQVLISYVLPSDSTRLIISVDVWSPCFIPETMPPGRKI